MSKYWGIWLVDEKNLDGGGFMTYGSGSRLHYNTPLLFTSEEKAQDEIDLCYKHIKPNIYPAEVRLECVK